MVLIKSSIILILTVASISSDNLSKRVRHFETLHSSHLSHTIVKRGLDPEGTHKFNKIREVGFRTLGRDFRLILSPKKGLLHLNFNVCFLGFYLCVKKNTSFM
jgi:disintegrin and metalloproteinase domain-containing protein 17